jgi:DNA-directed RNA polymerase alpha subunit
MRLFDRKEFLNLDGHQSDASVMVVQHTSKWEVSIRDCNRYVELFEYTDSVEKMKNGLYKLETMIEVLQQLRSKIIQRGIVSEEKSQMLLTLENVDCPERLFNVLKNITFNPKCEYVSKFKSQISKNQTQSCFTYRNKNSLFLCDFSLIPMTDLLKVKGLGKIRLNELENILNFHGFNLLSA